MIIYGLEVYTSGYKNPCTHTNLELLQLRPQLLAGRHHVRLLRAAPRQLVARGGEGVQPLDHFLRDFIPTCSVLRKCASETTKHGLSFLSFVSRSAHQPVSACVLVFCKKVLQEGFARTKLRTKEDRPLRCAPGGVFAPFIYKNERFTKTGSGQT